MFSELEDKLEAAQDKIIEGKVRFENLENQV